MIQNQIKLPLHVAFGVVIQGFRIRFGRSIVTVTGVVLGIAFLMSVLTNQALRDGVADEEALRLEADRMVNFLTAEIGPVRDRSLGIVLSGALSGAEQRIIRKLERSGLATAKVHSPAGLPVEELFSGVSTDAVDFAQTAEGTAAVVVMGEGGEQWNDDVRGLRESHNRLVVGMTRATESFTDGAFRIVALERELRPEEIAKREAEARRERFRGIWIVTISLLVTVIGISNSMLMSVTERFREIGTMKCLGALSAFIREIFLIESALMGVLGGVIGAILGLLVSIVAYSVTYGPGLTFAALFTHIGGLVLYVFVSLLASVALSIIAAIYPATVASRMVPATALRTNV